VSHVLVVQLTNHVVCVRHMGCPITNSGVSRYNKLLFFLNYNIHADTHISIVHTYLCNYIKKTDSIEPKFPRHLSLQNNTIKS
jgi:hypothetical protein